jgi:hypothetical protein
MWIFKGATSCRPLSYGACGIGEQCIPARRGLVSLTGAIFLGEAEASHAHRPAQVRHDPAWTILRKELSKVSLSP